MAKTNYFSVEGIAQWAQVTPGFEAVKYDFNGQDRDSLTLEQKECKITIEMDDENYEVFANSGTKKKAKKTENGLWAVTLSRDPTQLLGEDPLGYPVVVLGEEGREDYTDAIGNDSKVRVHFVVYPTSKFGNGTRLEGVRILDLVEYDGKQDRYSEETELPF
jgi:hypothetical protein